jgi:hypothetical protein
MNLLNRFVNLYHHEIIFGLLFFGMNLLWMWGEKLAGLHDVNIADHATYTNLFAIPSVLLYAFAMYKKQKDLGMQMPFMIGLKSGIGITLIVTALTPMMQYIIHTIITPEYFDNVKRLAITQGMKKEIAETHFSLNSYILLSVFASFMYGLFTSAITAFAIRFLGKKP